MEKTRRLGINGLFLRKPGTGIGQVTKYFLDELSKESQDLEYFIYTDDETVTSPLNEKGSIFYIKPWWKRDDLIRKLLWEHIQLPKTALAQNVSHFLSLYQAPTEFPKTIHHEMIVHDLIPEMFSEYLRNTRQRLIWNLTKRAIKAASHITAVSQSTKNDLVLRLKVKEENVSVAYPSVNPLFFEESKDESILEKYNLTPGYLYHGGGLEVRKNTESVLTSYAAWSQASKGEGEIPTLVLSGTIHSEKNPLATDVHGLIQKLGLEDSVKILGFVPDEDLPTLYRNASVFLFPSKYEGFGMPVVEALSQGVTVAVMRNSSLPEVGGEFVEWVDTLTKDTLMRLYQKSLIATEEQKEIRKTQARHFSSWKKFTEAILENLLQYRV